MEEIRFQVLGRGAGGIELQRVGRRPVELLQRAGLREVGEVERVAGGRGLGPGHPVSSGERVVGRDGERGGVGVVTAEVDGAELGRGPRVPGLFVLVRLGLRAGRGRGGGVGRGDRLGAVGRRVVGKRLGAVGAVERLLGQAAVTGERRVVEPGLLDAGERRVGRRRRRGRGARSGVRGRGHRHDRHAGSARRRPRPGAEAAARRRRVAAAERTPTVAASRPSPAGEFARSGQLHRGARPWGHHRAVRAARRRHRRGGGERGDRAGSRRPRGRHRDDAGGVRLSHRWWWLRRARREVRQPRRGRLGGGPRPSPGSGTAPSRSRTPPTDGACTGAAASGGRRGISVWQVLHLSLAPPGGMRRSSMLYAVWQDGHVMRMGRAPEASDCPGLYVVGGPSERERTHPHRARAHPRWRPRGPLHRLSPPAALAAGGEGIQGRRADPHRGDARRLPLRPHRPLAPPARPGDEGAGARAAPARTSWSTIQRRAAVFSRGVFTRFPYQVNTHGLPAEVVAENLVGFVEATVGEKGRALREREPRQLRGVHPPPHGRGLREELHGALQPEALDRAAARAAPPPGAAASCPKPSLKEVVDGALGLGSDALGYNASFVYPKEGGIEGLARALHGALPSGAGEIASRPSPWRSTGSAARPGSPTGARSRYVVAGLDHPAARAGGAARPACPTRCAQRRRGCGPPT